MKYVRSKELFALLLAALLLRDPMIGLLSRATAQTPDIGEGPRQPVTPVEICLRLKLLATKVEMKHFAGRMTVKDAFERLYEQLASKNVELPILVDSEEFTKDVPGLDFWAARVRLVRGLGRISVARFLREVLAQVPGRNATFVMRDSFLEVTTRQMMLREKGADWVAWHLGLWLP